MEFTKRLFSEFFDNEEEISNVSIRIIAQNFAKKVLSGK